MRAIVIGVAAHCHRTGLQHHAQPHHYERSEGAAAPSDFALAKCG